MRTEQGMRFWLSTSSCYLLFGDGERFEPYDGFGAERQGMALLGQRMDVRF